MGEPLITVNDDCVIINKRSPEMEGRFRVKAVTTHFSYNEGYKQEIEISRKTGEVPA